MALSAIIGAYSTLVDRPPTGANLTNRPSAAVPADLGPRIPPANQDGSKNHQNVSTGSVATTSGTLPKHSSSLLSEIMLNDDACRLLEFFKTDKQSAINSYFLLTPFRTRYDEYSELLGGFESSNTPFGAFYLGLALAHLLENRAWKNPFKRSYGRAARVFLQLAREDRENAAPAAFALVTIEAALLENDLSLGISEAEKEEAIELLRSATKFDTYILGYLSEMAGFDDQRSVSLLLRTAHLSELAIPNWNEFRVRWSQSQSLGQDEKLRIVDLIAANGQQAKKPSHHLGYSYLEHRLAQTLAGGARAYQTPEQIDAAFPGSMKTSFEKMMGKATFAAPCNEPKSDPANAALREYAKELRRLDAGVGVGL